MDDSESLFGSPPPSPTRGRSSSPTLALPTAAENNKNVGTIALPGSHFSEIPINPLALSLSFAPRPPAHSKAQSEAVPQSNRSSRNPSSSSSARSARRNNKSYSRPPPPKIHLPDPSQPTPPNFLRNQAALLGTAGLVSGLKPATLKHDTVGTTPHNPIVIEDTHPQRTITGQRTPTIREIVYTLVKQKNIFPVLASILKLIAQGHAQPSTPPPPSRQSSDDGRPTKRRKLRNVPAGAADWDVPFPFGEDEGPKAYRKNWEKERGKQLLSQLVTIVKAATEKAAVRGFFENEGHAALAQLFGKQGHQQPDNAVQLDKAVSTASTTPQRPSVVLKDSSNGKSHTPSPESSQPLSRPVDTSGQLSAMDELVTSFLASQSNVSDTTGALPATDANALFDSWMSIFQSLPEQSAAASDDPFAFMTTPAPALQLGDLDNPQPVLDPALEPPSTFAQGEYSGDFAIDPSLLAFSMPPTTTVSSSNGSVWSSYPSSSVASPSSCQDFGSIGWSAPVDDNSFGLLPDLHMNERMLNFNVSCDAHDHSAEVSDNNFTTQLNRPIELQDMRTIWDGTTPSVGLDAVKDKGKGKDTAAAPSNEDVIKLAKQRRQELSDELLKTRTQLWETTIEQGVLASLAQAVNESQD